MNARRPVSVAIRQLAASAILLFAAAPVAAQDPDPFGPLAVFQLADRQEWVIRASLSNGDQVVGRVREIEAASARLEGGRVRFADLVLLERGERRWGGGFRGAVIGGAILGVLTVVGLSVAPVDQDLDGSDYLLAFQLGAGVGAVLGGLIGAALASSETQWMPIWPGHSVGGGR